MRKKAAPAKAEFPHAEATGNAPNAGASFSVEAHRQALARKLMRFAADWRHCPRRVCRRVHACTPPADAWCSAPERPARPVTEDEWAREKAALKRALDRRLSAIRR
ncbi:MAG: hypothetical protein J0H89_11470 [Rhizobiales bacterium]|jgi:hypothetical protein|nr:hypothetical protein [Hyphomicrobiales bacterium]